jgi:membrane protein YqaA with SNARE-associated domain
LFWNTCSTASLAPITPFCSFVSVSRLKDSVDSSTLFLILDQVLASSLGSVDVLGWFIGTHFPKTVESRPSFSHRWSY